MLQGRPALLPGDTVFLRSEAHPGHEIGGVLLATDGTSCLLAPPPGFWCVLLVQRHRDSTSNMHSER